MQNQIQNVSISDQITLENPNKIAWGPSNLLAIASENIVTIYHTLNNKLKIFNKIIKHKAKITSLSWNFPTIEFHKLNSFDILLAVGDEDGNCLIYDLFSLSRRGGISPSSCSTSLSILDIKWKIDDPSTLFILTAQPSLLSISVGTAESLGRSKMKLTPINSNSYHSINISLLWIQNIESGYKRISLDLFDPNRILITSPQTFNYFAIKISFKSRQNAYNNSISDILRFPIDETQKLLHIEYFPFRQNGLLLLTNQNLYLFNLFTKAISSIISCNHLKTFCFCSGIFSHSISDRFWLATTDGSIYRYHINNEISSNDVNEEWTIDCMISSPKSQSLFGIFSDYLNPDRIFVVYKNGIAIIKEIPNSIKNKNLITSRLQQKQKADQNQNVKLDQSQKNDQIQKLDNNQNINLDQTKRIDINEKQDQNSKSNDKSRVGQALFLEQDHMESMSSVITRSYSLGSNRIEKQNFYQILNQTNHFQVFPQSEYSSKFRTTGHYSKLFITSFIPSLTDQLVSWTADRGRVALLSSAGHVSILCPPSEDDHIFNYLSIEKVCARYRIEGITQGSQVSFYKDDSIIVNGGKLYIINYKDRGETTEISKNVTKFVLKEDILAFTPTLSSFELYTINRSSFTKDFAANIKLFCPCYDDKTKWALLLASPSNLLIIVGYLMPKRYEIDENVFGSIVSVAFAGENVYLATSKSIIHMFNLASGEKRSLLFSSVSMRSIAVYKKFVMACDMSGKIAVLSANDLAFVSTFQCFGKDIQVLNDSYCVVQTRPPARPVLMLHKFPSLEIVRTTVNNNVQAIIDAFWSIPSQVQNDESTVGANDNDIKNTNIINDDIGDSNCNDADNHDINNKTSNNNDDASSSNDSDTNNNNINDDANNESKNNNNDDDAKSLNSIKKAFLRCRTVDEFERFAHQIGDLMFLQFLQVAKHENDTILPSIHCITRSKASDNEKCVMACNCQNSAFTDEYIEYLILTGQFERAAKFALNKVNKQNILLAHACLSPNVEAVKKIMEIIPTIKGSEKVFSLLLKIAGDSNEAANVASKIADGLSSIKFLKLICNDDEIKKFIKCLKIYKENVFTMAFVDDYQSTFTILLNMNEISKAYAYMALIEERINKEKDITDDSKKDEEVDHFFYDNLKIQLNYSWNKLM